MSTGTGASILANLESQYTLKGLFQASFYDRTINASTNFFGQVGSNNFKFEKINYFQPVAAFFINNKLVENAMESSIFYGKKEDESWGFKSNSFNEFSESFYGNLFGDMLSSKFESLTKPVYDFSKILKPTIDAAAGTVIETMETKFSENVVVPFNEKFSSSESMKNMNKSKNKLKN